MLEEFKDDEDFLQNNQERFRPFVTIWFRPRETVRQAIVARPMGLIYLLVIAMMGMQMIVNVYNSDLPIDFTPLWVMVVVVIGAGLGLIGWLLNSWLYVFVGHWLGGHGQVREMRVGIGIAYIPVVVASVLSLSAFLVLEVTGYSTVGIVFSLICNVLAFVFSVWSVVTYVKAIAEVHGFSAWRGLGTSLIAGLLIWFVVFILLMILYIIILSVLI